jgi:hypothetical protein
MGGNEEGERGGGGRRRRGRREGGRQSGRWRGEGIIKEGLVLMVLRVGGSIGREEGAKRS